MKGFSKKALSLQHELVIQPQAWQPHRGRATGSPGVHITVIFVWGSEGFSRNMVEPPLLKNH